MLKENRTLTLIKVGREEALTCFDAHASQDEASYDGDVSDAEDDSWQSDPWWSRWHTGWKTKKFKRLPTRVVVAKPRSLQTRTQLINTATRLHLGHEVVLSVMIEASSPRDAMENIQKTTFLCTVSSKQVGFLWAALICFFHTDVTLTDGLTLQGGGWPGVPWYPDMPETRAALWDLSWFIKICQGLFPRVWVLQDFPYPSQLHLAHHITLRRTSNIALLWGAYVEYPCQQNMAPVPWPQASVRKWVVLMSKILLTPWTRTASPTSSHVCPFCNKLHNSRDLLMNHIRFHYHVVLVCPTCGGCGWNQWGTVKGHIKKCCSLS